MHKTILISLLMVPLFSFAKVEIPCESQVNEALKVLGQPQLGKDYAVKAGPSEWRSLNGFKDQNTTLGHILRGNQNSINATQARLEEVFEEIVDLVFLNQAAIFGQDWQYSIREIQTLVDDPYGEGRLDVYLNNDFAGEKQSYRTEKKYNDDLLAHCNKMSDCDPKEKQRLLGENKKISAELGFLEGIESLPARKRVKELSAEFQNLYAEYSRRGDYPYITRVEAKNAETAGKNWEQCVKDFKPALSKSELEKLEAEIKDLLITCRLIKSELVSQCRGNIANKSKLLEQNSASTACAAKNDRYPHFILNFREDSLDIQTDSTFSINRFEIDTKTCEYVSKTQKPKRFKKFSDFALESVGCNEWFKNDREKAYCEKSRKQISQNLGLQSEAPSSKPIGLK
jgi:hypothetical protein